MGTRKDKALRREVRRNVGDLSRQYLGVMLGSPLLTRLRWAAVIVFRLRWRKLAEGDRGTERAAQG